jgi:AcrR family transcriptional regulator
MNTATSAATKGRPREFCVDMALGKALRVFWTKGYEGASLSDLTEAMGVTRPSLYAAFGNKEELFRKALDLYESEKLAYMREAIKAPTARAVAEKLLRGALMMQTSDCDPHGCLRVISSVACGVEAESIREEVLQRRKSSHETLRKRFEEAEAAGELPPTMNADGLTSFLSALLQGLSLQAGAGASREELAELVETSLKLWPTR